jgi:exopolysaccharide biosynthesis polyprenyl glycosylphosphotransferase
MVKEHNQVVVALMGVLDLAITAGAWVFCYFVRFDTGWFPAEVIPPLRQFLDVIFISLLLTWVVFSRQGLYLPWRVRSLRAEAFDVIRACVIVWLILLGVSYFLHSAFVSRRLLGMLLIVWPAMLVGYRTGARSLLRFLRRRGVNNRSIAIVGAGRAGQKLLHNLRRQRWTGYRIAYFVEDHRIGEEFLGVPVRGPIQRVGELVEDNPVDAVFVALPQARSEQMADVLDQLSTGIADVNVVPDLLHAQFLRHRVQQVGTLSVINLTHSPQSGWNAMIKRTFDVVTATLLLILLLPVLLAAAIAVKLSSPGPIFYRQKRASIGGREFTIIKFRSMVCGEDDGSWSTSRNDPRITRVGHWLRRLNIDELPQLLNVLKGDMSLVGPRPELPRFIERFNRQFPRYMLRHHVKAGITGWAQVHGLRGRGNLRRRLQYDLDYINRWSLGLDIWILLLTPFRAHRNAG